MPHIWPLPLVEFASFSEIEETRPALVVATARARAAAAGFLDRLTIAREVLITEASLPRWMEQAADLLRASPDLDSPVLFAVGGGLAADAAKYFSAQTNLPLVCLPTALSADAFLSPLSAVRHDGCIEYVETRPPDRVVIDFDFLAGAPEHLRAAGICDLLSIATALWDWEYAEECEENTEGMELVPWAADAAMSLLQGALDCAEDAGAGDPAGLKQLLDCLALEVQLCNQLGHARPTKGSEHAFAYAVQNHLRWALPHAELVGPGILQMAAWQDQDADELKEALRACRVRLDRIPQPTIQKTLAELPGYVRAHQLPYGIAYGPEEE